MKINKCLLGIILMLICPQIESFMIGYARLFEPNTQTTIDVLWDAHMEHPTNQLFSSEVKLEQVLSTLNERNENVDIVWEYDEAMSSQLLQRGASSFIMSFPRHIAENFTNLNFIAADLCRHSGYAALFKWDSASHSSFKYLPLQYTNAAGSTFEEPVPFGPERRSRVLLEGGLFLITT